MAAAAPAREAVSPAADPRFVARELPALTGLRFVAALGVVLCHATTEWRTGLISTTSGRTSTWSIEAILARILGDGWLGVNLFFLLSGFILAYTYTNAAGHWRGTRRAFYVARLARIYPVYLLALVISALPALWHSFALSMPFINIPATLTFTELWLPHPDIAWCGAGWSLAPEAFFYLLFPLLALPCARLSRRQAVWLLGLCWLGTLLVVLGYHGQMHRWLYTTLPLVRLPEFVMGVVAARLFVLNDTHAAGGRRLAWMTIAASLGCLGVLATGSAMWPDTWLRTGLWDPVFVLLIVALARGGGGIARALSSRMAIILGEASYSLYLLHLPLWTVVTHVLHEPMIVTVREPLMALPLLAGYLLGVVGVSILTFRVLEQPARRKIRRALS
jgi:peptidoglycan/LPS O-acetylase OafA/YrhL